jgi:hypothetical protein
MSERQTKNVLVRLKKNRLRVGSFDLSKMGGIPKTTKNLILLKSKFARKPTTEGSIGRKQVRWADHLAQINNYCDDNIVN